VCVCVYVWMGTVCLGREGRKAGEEKDGGLYDAGISAFHATAGLVVYSLGPGWCLVGQGTGDGRGGQEKDRTIDRKNHTIKIAGKNKHTRRMGAAGGITNGSREVVGRGSPINNCSSFCPAIVSTLRQNTK